MANTIKIKRGLSTDISQLTLSTGELAILLDSGELKYGDQNGEVADLYAATAGSLANEVTINGVPFTGTADITTISPGKHIIIDGSTINVSSIGTLTDLNTDNKNDIVGAINEIDSGVNTLSTNMNAELASIKTRLNSLEGQDITFDVSSLSNELMTLNKEAMTVGNEATRLNFVTDGDIYRVSTGDEVLLNIGVNNNTGEIGVSTSNLVVDDTATLAYHRAQKFTSNGEQRTGWYYVGGVR